MKLVLVPSLLSLLFASTAFAGDQGKDYEAAWAPVAKAIKDEDHETLWGMFSASAQAWTIGEEGQKAYKAEREAKDADFDGVANLMNLTVEAAKKLDAPEFGKRLSTSLACKVALTRHDYKFDSARIRGEEYELTLKGSGGQFTRVVFVREKDQWKLAASWVASLLHAHECSGHQFQLAVYLALHESRYKGYPSSLKQLKDPMMLKDERFLSCPEDGSAYEYLFPMEGDAPPPDRIMIHDAKAHADGTRVLVTFAGAVSWVDEERFQEWYKRDLAAIREGIDGWMEKVKELSSKPGADERAMKLWAAGLASLKEKIKDKEAPKGGEGK